MEESNTEALNPSATSMISATLITHTPGILSENAASDIDPVSTLSGPSSPPPAEELLSPIEPLVQLAPHPLSETSSSSSSSTLVLVGTMQSATRSPEASSSAAARLLPDSSPIVEHVAQSVPSGLSVTAPVVSATNDESLPIMRQTSHEPIRIRGTGHITLFGLNNKFSEDYPLELTGKVAPEEFTASIQRTNAVIARGVPVAFRCLMLGCVCCFCTAGASLAPAICLSTRTRHALEKQLDWENHRLYHKLGLHWSLTKIRSDNTGLTDYVLQIEGVGRPTVCSPD